MWTNQEKQLIDNREKWKKDIKKRYCYRAIYIKKVYINVEEIKPDSGRTQRDNKHVEKKHLKKRHISRIRTNMETVIHVVMTN